MRLDLVMIVIAALALSWTTGCGNNDRDRENYGDITATPSGIILQDPEKHMGGYGRNECLVCHNAALNLHRGPRAVINVEELNRSIRANGEAKFCLNCHGRNGTEGT